MAAMLSAMLPTSFGRALLVIVCSGLVVLVVVGAVAAFWPSRSASPRRDADPSHWQYREGPTRPQFFRAFSPLLPQHAEFPLFFARFGKRTTVLASDRPAA